MLSSITIFEGIHWLNGVHWLNGAGMCVLDEKNDWWIKGNGIEYSACLCIEGAGAPFQIIPAQVNL